MIAVHPMFIKSLAEYKKATGVFEEAISGFKKSIEAKDEAFQQVSSDLLHLEDEYNKLKAKYSELENRACYNEKSNLKNHILFEKEVLLTDGKDLKWYAMLDLDSLKWYNDNLGYDQADELLNSIGGIVRELELFDVTYHKSGDEFFVIGGTEEEAESRAKMIQDGLKKIERTFDVTYKVSGIGVSFGVGNSKEGAESELKCNKAERVKSGERVARGEKPGTVKLLPKEINNS